MKKQITKTTRKTAEATTKPKLPLKIERLRILNTNELASVVGGKCEVGTCDPGTWI